MDPYLSFGNSLFGHHYDPFFQLLINDYAEVLVEDHAKQDNYALPVTGVIAKLSASKK